MTIVRELLTVVGFVVDESDVEKAEKALENVFNAATKVSFGFNQIFDAASNGMALVQAGAEALTAAPEAMFELAEATATAGDRLAKTGLQIGLTAEELQRMEFAAERSGVEVDGVRDVFKDLSKNLADAGDGNEGMIASFRKLGVSVKDQNGRLKGAQDVLLEIADGIQKIPEPARRAQLSMAIMGEAGLKMAPLLAGGSAGIKDLTDRADELGFVMSNEAAAASEAFLDNLTDFRRSVDGVSGSLGVQLLPQIGKLLQRLTALVLRFKPLLEDGPGLLAEAFLFLGNTLIDGIETLEKYSGFLKTMAVVLAAVGSVILVQLMPAIFTYIAGLELLTLAQLKAVAIPALMAAGFLALAAVIALVIEDIHAFVSGGESAIGNLLKAFQESPQDPDEHWAVRILRFIVVNTAAAVKAVDAFFKGFFEDAERLGGISEAISNLFDVAVQGWKDAILGAFDFILEKAKGLAGKLADIPFVGRIFTSDEPVTSPLPTSPRGAPPPPSAGFPGGPRGGAQTNVANTVQGGPVTVNVNGAVGSPAETATAVSDSLSDVMDQDRRETLRAIEAGSRAVR